jgi:hypothetical protein
VLHILNNLDSNALFDLSKTFAKQKKSINKKLLPAVKSAMNPSMKKVYDSEIIKIIKQLHKSCRKYGKRRKKDEKKSTQNVNMWLLEENKYIIYIIFQYINYLKYCFFNRK